MFIDLGKGGGGEREREREMIEILRERFERETFIGYPHPLHVP